jgi:hypothetical protein
MEVITPGRVGHHPISERIQPAAMRRTRFSGPRAGLNQMPGRSVQVMNGYHAGRCWALSLHLASPSISRFRGPEVGMRPSDPVPSVFSLTSQP